MLETVVLVTATASGLMFIATHLHLSERRMASTAAGIMDVCSGCPFCVIVANVSGKWIYLPKHLLVAVGTPLPDYVVHLEVDEQYGPERSKDETKRHRTKQDSVNAVHDKHQYTNMTK